MKKIYSATFEIDDDPDLSNSPEYERSYEKYNAEIRAMKIEDFLKEYAIEFHRIS